MSRVDLREPYAVRQLRESVRDSLRSHGEQVILLSLFHAHRDAGEHPRCHCHDDVYKQPERKDCPDCFGTGFAGGVKQMARAWAAITPSTNDEQYDRKGQWMPTQVSVQTEGAPSLWQSDIFARVLSWTKDYVPTNIEGFYILSVVEQNVLRTGNDFGQEQQTIVGQTSRKALRLDESHPIYRLTDRLMAGPVPRIDGLRR